MANITENLQTIYDCRVDIKQAIIDKGGEVGDLTTYADAIYNIPSGGSGGSSEGSESSLNFDGVVANFTNANCREVTHLIIKEGVTTLRPTIMGEGAFAYWNIESVEFPLTLTTIDTDAFKYTKLKKITIPNSVTYIGSRCFANTEQLQYVIMPNRLSSMDGDEEFYGSSVEYIYFNNAEIIPSIGYWGMIVGSVFEDHTKIIVPDSLYDSWRNANGWSEYADQIYKASEYPIPNE